MQLGRIIDADGHILEPPDLWKENLESKYKDRALGIGRDAEGWETLIVDGGFGALKVLKNGIQELSPPDQQNILGDNATRAYGL